MPISIAELEELVKTRIWLETLALTESMKNRDDAWEEQLVVSFHRLARTQRQLPDDSSRETSQEWEARHKDFHMLLLNRCGSSWLLDFCSTLMDQAVRYRNLSMNTAPNKQRREGAAAEHSAILDAVLDHDTARACALLVEHYRVTLESLQTVLVPEDQDQGQPPSA
jgi:DNA-binding GntR family transcriptional regulator